MAWKILQTICSRFHHVFRLASFHHTGRAKRVTDSFSKPILIELIPCNTASFNSLKNNKLTW